MIHAKKVQCITCLKEFADYWEIYTSENAHHEVLPPEGSFELPYCDNVTCERYGLATAIVRLAEKKA